MSEVILDMSDAAKKCKLLNRLKCLEGPHRITVVKYRPRRTDRQNRYYWPCFVQMFRDFLADQGQPITREEAHEFFKRRFLTREIVNPQTGEVMETTASTADLTTAEFNQYLDTIAAWLHDSFGMIVPEPNEYHIQEDE